MANIGSKRRLPPRIEEQRKGDSERLLMTLIIQLRTNFAFNVPASGNFSVPSEVKTILDLLRHISREIDFDLIDPESGELDIDLEITINGKDLWFFPTGLKTRLNDGDSVLISLIPLGGGQT